MCLAYPMKVVEIKGRYALAEAEGIKRRVVVELIRDLKIGEYVMVHAGFAIEKIETNQAKETLEIFKEYNDALRKGFKE